MQEHSDLIAVALGAMTTAKELGIGLVGLPARLVERVRSGSEPPPDRDGTPEPAGTGPAAAVRGTPGAAPYPADPVQRAVAEERARIAHGLHDVVGHGLTLVSLRARADRASPQRRLALVDETAQQTLRDLGRLVAGLDDHGPGHGGSAAPVEVRPALTRVVADFRWLGLTIRFPDGDDEALPADTATLLERALRETLVNAAKHSPGAWVSVRLIVRTAVTVHVVTGPPPVSAGARPRLAGWGVGLRGLHEQLCAVGGALRAQPTRSGGFVVSATVPRPDTPAPTSPVPTRWKEPSWPDRSAS